MWANSILIPFRYHEFQQLIDVPVIYLKIGLWVVTQKDFWNIMEWSGIDFTVWISQFYWIRQMDWIVVFSQTKIFERKLQFWDQFGQLSQYWINSIGCKKSPDPPGLFHWILNHFLKWCL
jgi:hypothetical protein